MVSQERKLSWMKLFTCSRQLYCNPAKSYAGSRSPGQTSQSCRLYSGNWHVEVFVCPCCISEPHLSAPQPSSYTLHSTSKLRLVRQRHSSTTTRLKDKTTAVGSLIEKKLLHRGLSGKVYSAQHCKCVLQRPKTARRKVLSGRASAKGTGLLSGSEKRPLAFCKGDFRRSFCTHRPVSLERLRVESRESVSVHGTLLPKEARPASAEV